MDEPEEVDRQTVSSFPGSHGGVPGPEPAALVSEATARQHDIQYTRQYSPVLTL